ncbi:DUF488 domain-containing protein [Chitinophaga vietnamensis]|uniref:DUF488 domain-containing protein n=1 Tax=Chitinophaga vietnamensis TaxID=2593957 RepID=UPI00117809FF|nr:DUF488 domain-containing protein [Chitinophaga vietnamensis]
MITIKRVYEPYEASDGYRILVDRLWPRGLTKEKAHVDEWLKEIAPSDALRKWFHHEESNFGEFKKRYEKELKDHQDLADHILEKAKQGRVTLLYGAKDETNNQARVLADWLRKK